MPRPYGEDMRLALYNTQSTVEALRLHIKTTGRRPGCGPEADRLRVNLDTAADKLLWAIGQVICGIEAAPARPKPERRPRKARSTK